MSLPSETLTQTERVRFPGFFQQYVMGDLCYSTHLKVVTRNFRLFNVMKLQYFSGSQNEGIQLYTASLYCWRETRRLNTGAHDRRGCFL
jgi:hypothetical protein